MIEKIFSATLTIIAMIEKIFSETLNIVAMVEKIFSTTQNIVAVIEKIFSGTPTIIVMIEKIFSVAKTIVAVMEKIFSLRKTIVAATEKIFSLTKTMVTGIEKILLLTKTMVAATEKIFSFANTNVSSTDTVVSAARMILSDVEGIVFETGTLVLEMKTWYQSLRPLSGLQRKRCRSRQADSTTCLFGHESSCPNATWTSDNDVRPGCVLSLQTYGAYGANFNPHCHELISDGAFSPEGEFLPLPSLDASAVCQLFQRLLLLRLHQAERLSESFMQNLLSWVHSGFSVYAGPPVEAAEIASLESQARYIFDIG